MRDVGGRPSKYDPEMCARVLGLGAQGKSKAQMAAALGVAGSTFRVWVNEHDEFRRAVEDAAEAAQAWWEDLGQTMAESGEGSASAFIFQMKNRFSRDYRDAQDHNHGGQDGRNPIITEVRRVIVDPDDSNR